MQLVRGPSILGLTRWGACVAVAVMSLFIPEMQHGSVAGAFSIPNKNQGSPTSSISRRNLLYWPIGVGGAVIYSNLVADAIGKLSRGDLVYPEEHEQKVSKMISQSLVNAVASSNQKSLRVLEVGIGNQCRVLRRGLYDGALKDVAQQGTTHVDLVGVDISIPPDSIQQLARERLLRAASNSQLQSASLKLLEHSITSQLPFPDGFFDAVLCSLTLCSVDDPPAAIREIQRLVRPHGGTFGYVEHVAVNADEPYRLLAWQQQVFDPLQQLVADNCHLHRKTDDSIDGIFEIQSGSSLYLARERFLVDGMWPVSCQASGVLQKR